MGITSARAGLFTQHLPRHDVGVVLHARDQDFITGTDGGPQIGLGHQIDGLGGAAGEHQLIAVRGALMNARDAVTGAFIQVSGLLAEQVHAAVNIGVVRRVEIHWSPRSPPAAAGPRRRYRDTPAVCRVPGAARIGKSLRTRSTSKPDRARCHQRQLAHCASPALPPAAASGCHASRRRLACRSPHGRKRRSATVGPLLGSSPDCAGKTRAVSSSWPTVAPWLAITSSASISSSGLVSTSACGDSNRLALD